MILFAAIVSLTALVLAGLLRAGAASLVRTPRADALHDAAEGAIGAGKVAALLEERDLIVPGINIVHSFLLVVAAIPGAWVLSATTDGVGLALVLVILGLVLVVVADLLPRSLGRTRPRSLAYRLAPLLAPAIRAGSRAAEIIRDDEAQIEEDDHDDDEVELITSVLEFSETIVREVMVPRPDMVVVEADARLQELLRVVDEHGFSRIPAVGESVDDVVGMVIVKDLLPKLANGDHPTHVRDVMRSIDFVPETKRVSDLLREMQASKLHMAVVVDEYGGTAGLVTIEDLLEELVGEIVDEYDEDELLVELQDDGTWKVDGRMPVSELSELLHTNLPEDDWDTAAGLVLGLAGRVPHVGERFEAGDVVFTVSRVQGRRVSEVLVSEALVPAEDEA